MKKVLYLISAGLLLLIGWQCSQTPKFKNYPLETFFDYKAVSSATFSPEEKTIAYISNASGVHNIWTVPTSGGTPKQLTNEAKNTIVFVTWCPNRDSLIYGQDQGGNENFHLYIMPARGGPATELTPGANVRAEFLKWAKDGNSFLYMSNQRIPQFFDIYKMDLNTGKSEMLYQTQGSESFADWSDDGKKLAFSLFYVATDMDALVYDIESKKMENLTEHQGQGEIVNGPVTFSPDSKWLYFVNDKDSEFMKLKRINLATKAVETIEEPDWDVISAGFSFNGRYFVTGINEDGSTKIKITDVQANKEVPLPQLPNGEIKGLDFSRSERYLIYYFNGDRQPTNLYIVDLQNNKNQQLTNSLPKEIDQRNLSESELVRYATFDGKQIPAYLYKPVNLKAGEKRPVIIEVHGGPMFQSTKSFSPLRQYLVNNGYVVLLPNVRGSTGYGKTYHILDDHDWGGAPLQDVVWGKKFLATLDYVDTAKVVILGGSYGGYMTLAGLTFAPDVFAAGVDICGPSNLQTLLASVPPYWEPFIKYFHREVGDPKKDQKFLKERSPLFSADRIQRPLFVIQGANDPRVKQQESDQIVDALKKKGGVVEYMIFPDEGHGLRKKENQIKAYNRVREFLDQHIMNKAS